MQFQTNPRKATPTPPPLLRRVDRPDLDEVDYEDEEEYEEDVVETAVPADVEPDDSRITGIGPIARYLWMRLTKMQVLAIGVLIGVAIGLPLLGWWLWPVQWTNASFNELGPTEQALVIETVADYYAYSRDPVRVAAVLHDWQDGESLVCAMAAQEDDFWAKARLISIAAVRNGRGCE